MRMLGALLENLIKNKREIRVNQLEGEDLLLYLEKQGALLCEIEIYLDILLQVKTQE